jgi:hypothetical protein
VVRGGADNINASSRILTNVTVNAATPSLLLTNLTAGVTYSVSASAATRAGPGPPSFPATLRLDPTSRLLLKDHHHRYDSHYLHPVKFPIRMQHEYLIVLISSYSFHR